jgi:hypothetical protein
MGDQNGPEKCGKRVIELGKYSNEHIDIDESLQYDLAFHAWE